MEGSKTLAKKPGDAETKKLNFEVSTGLKRVLGRELITDDEVAIFEMVKNSFDAGADTVNLYFEEDSVVVADNGSGMSFDDLKEKWLFVAYSSKRDDNARKDFRDLAAERGTYAGSKGIGRFSSDRLGQSLVLQTRPKRTRTVHKLTVDWRRFERDDKEHFEKVPVAYEETSSFELPSQLAKFGSELAHGTVIEVGRLRRRWDRQRLLDLKASLAKLINPFGADADRFSIYITAPAEVAGDKQARAAAAKAREEPVPGRIVNGRVENFIFSTLRSKTTYIVVSIDGDQINTTLTDRGEVIYKIREPNTSYPLLKNSGFRCEMYYLNQSAKATFARRIGVQSVKFGSVFLFRNGFRVYPVGDDGDDWFGFDRRKQQGFRRFLGTREIIGRVDVVGSGDDFQEASSRNQGLIETPAVRQLRKAVMSNCLRRLERYVVPVSWVDKADANAEDLSRLLTDPGRARVSAAVASLVDSDDVELLAYSKRLVGLINERSSEFEASLVSLRSIADKTGDKALLAQLDKAEKRFEDLRKSEAEARAEADRQREAAEAADQRAQAAEAAAEEAKSEAATERQRAHFLESVVSLDTATILNLHHQVTIYAVDIAQQIENLLTATAGQKTVPRETMLKAVEQMAFLNRKVLAVTKFAAKAKFKLDSEKIDSDLAGFITEYIEEIARMSGSARLKIEVKNDHPGLKLRFNPIDASIIVDNLISNARRAKASKIKFELSPLDKTGLLLRVSDNGRGLAPKADKKRIFEMGYTTTHGSGLGLYHVRQVLGEMGGSIELDNSADGKGASFLIKIVAGRKSK